VGKVRAPNIHFYNRTAMDTLNTHNLTNTERIELMARIQKLQWLLKECIGIEEYELCSQIRNLIQRKYELLETNQSHNITE
jgi:protein-arginine kinase activator protein McsA